MRTILMTGAALLGFASAAHAQQFADASDTPENVVVTATRVAQSADEVPATVSVITDQDIENQLADSIKDIVRYEPGVSVRASPSRFGAALASTGRDGNSGFNIRGLEDNRVLMTVDGIRIPDGFSFGPAAFGRGDYVDLDLLRSVEILRGPASALYGSDGVAGAVSFITKDPSDFLHGDENFAGRARVSYGGADESWAENVIAAGRASDWSAYLSYTRRDGHELDNQGDNDALNASRTTPNPQEAESNAVLARVVFAPSDTQRFRLTYDWGNRQVDTDALSGRSATVLNLIGTDKSDRQRVSFDHHFELSNSFITRGYWAVYWQDANSSEFSFEDRNPAADRTRLTTFDNTVWGGAVQLESVATTGWFEHHFVYGGDYSKTHQEGLRDGTVPSVGDFFPQRAFPITDYTMAGAFLQDEISVDEGRLTFFPALRYDTYDLTPHADALFPAATAGQSDSHLSPKFGIVAWPSEHFGAYVNYAEGFKAPAPSQVNNFFQNPIFGYTSIPNPDLQPETSSSFEAGVRMRDIDFAGGAWRGSLAGFGAWYDDFITQDVVGGSGAPGDPLIFQYINIASAQISGIEASISASWRNGFGLRFAYSTADGEDTSLGGHAPLNSVEPWKLVAGLTYDDPDGRFGGQLIATHSAAKDPRDIDSSSCATTCFASPSFTIVDLTAYWNITGQASLRIGAFNLTDEKYWWWGDVRGNDASSTVLDAYTQPGRNFSASIAYRF
ncbi:MAG: TonB-dependent hemoglobin/transferrin/lactoferrin family receptor [Terricaulis sp.]